MLQAFLMAKTVKTEKTVLKALPVKMVKIIFLPKLTKKKLQEWLKAVLRKLQQKALKRHLDILRQILLRFRPKTASLKTMRTMRKKAKFRLFRQKFPLLKTMQIMPKRAKFLRCLLNQFLEEPGLLRHRKVIILRKWLVQKRQET